MKGLTMNVYERREQISRLIFNNPMNTNQIVDALGVEYRYIRHDLQYLYRRGDVQPCGWIGGMRTYKGIRIVQAQDLHKRIDQKADISKAFDIANISEPLRLMFGYTEIEPKGGERIGEDRFHQTPRSNARVKVYPGTSWGDVALRMPFA
jgi:hypothetical protein